MKETNEKTKKKKLKLPKWLRFILDKFWLLLGALAILLGLIAYAKSCSSRNSSNVQFHALYNDRLNISGQGASVGDTVKPFNELPITSNILIFDSEGDYYHKLVTSYLSITLTYEGSDSDNSSLYSFSSIDINCKVTGDGLTYYDISYSPTMGQANLSTDGWLVLMIYADDLNSIKGKCAFSEYNYVRQSIDSYADSMLYNIQTANVGHMEALDEFLDDHCGGCSYFDNYSVRQFFFFFSIELTRLIDLADAYSFGYMQGYLNGISRVVDNAANYDLHYDYEVEQAYNNGFQDGMREVNGNNIPALIYTVFNAPSAILNGMFNFDIFGINVANVLKFFITVGVVIFVVKFFKGGK